MALQLAKQLDGNKIKQKVLLLTLLILMITIFACTDHYVNSKLECEALLRRISKIEVQENYIMYKGPGLGLPKEIRCYVPK